MNRMWNILKIALLSTLFVGCSQTEDTNLDQRDDIIEYLEGSHDPNLVSESDAAESLDDDPPFYVTAGGVTFRYIEDYYNVDRESMPLIEKGSTISITYTLYNFEDYSDPTEEDILLSNDPEQIALLEELDGGLNPTYWDTEPLTFKVGSGKLMGSIETLLVGCRQGDYVEFYLTIDDAYGSSEVGIAPEGVPLAFYCEILTVN